ncbi:hypothetical protein, partial [Megamonas hypermegale]
FVPAKKNCPAQYKNKLRKYFSLCYIVPNGTFFNLLSFCQQKKNERKVLYYIAPNRHFFIYFFDFKRKMNL